MARRAGLGRRGRPPLDVLVRLNPEVTPETIAGLAVGDGASKFGMTETEATGLVEWLATNAGGAIRPRGVHLHVGSQLRAVDAWRDAVRRGLAVVGLLRGNLDTFDTLDVGGGFPVLPEDEPVPAPERFARELPDLLASVPEVAVRRASPSSPAGLSWRGPAGSWPASCTCATAADARSSSMPA